MQPKFIFVSGGVISGLGKGITTASISLLLKSCGYRVAPVKCDAYVNIDAGTIRPQEHGEIFVCDDGIETDQDLGHYERFIDESLSRANYITTGQIYQEVIRKERAFEYKGEDVEVVPHIPEEMMRRFKEAGKKMKADFVLVEIGGTVGEYQNILFIEANRIMKVRDKEAVLHIHVGYLPTPPSIGEMKSKPVQTSVRLLNETGIQPDFLIARAEKPLDTRRKERLALFCNVASEDIISNPDVKSIYETPLIFEEQQLGKKILKKFGLRPKKRKNLKEWRRLVKRIKMTEKPGSKKVKIGMIGKYQRVGEFRLEDAYISVVEAIKHASWANGVRPEVIWFDSEQVENEGTKGLGVVDGIIVPQGWGSRGVEGKIKAIQYARENKIPYLGLCFGMQMAVIEFGRNVVGLKKANSVEVNPKTPYPVIHIMPDQEKYLTQHQYGGTIRLGAWPCKILPKSRLHQAYGRLLISERHRHRYEFNNRYRQQFEKAGMKISGVSPDGKLIEAIEIPNHPFFIGTQFHPEYKSRPLKPHPLFLKFIKAAKEKNAVHR
jgi:CTP synthase